MSEASERPRGGGLARSIDAFFTGSDEKASPASQPADPATRLVAELAVEREEERREELFDACARLGLRAARALADALATTEDRFARRAYSDALIRMGADGLPVVEEMMDDPRWFVVRNGVSILGEVGGERAVELLTGALARPEPKVRRDALLALAKQGGSDAGQLAYGMLDDPTAMVRAAAATAAGELGVERAVRLLQRMLANEDDPDVTLAVLHALGRLADPGAVQAIERQAVGSFLRRPPPDVRIAAYRALRHIGTPRARRLLNQAVDDRDPAVKAEVRRLLGMS
ncbi:MAG: HEAT repeat domain-containing protein [Gemmatimonadota bacterium]|nr:HEAT repeat domain-containing protein [Gemmatimonadota bacterium]